MKPVVVFVLCSLLFFKLNQATNAQGSDRFFKEAPVAWAEYREKLSTDLQIVVEVDRWERFSFIVTKQGQTIHKKHDADEKQFEFAEMFDGKSYFRYSNENGKWTGIRQKPSTAKVSASQHSKQSESEIFRLLLVASYGNRFDDSLRFVYLDELLRENPKNFESVKSITIDGKEYSEVVIHISNAPRRACTAVLDPRNHWTIKSFVCRTYEKTQTRKEEQSFETTNFLGVAVPSVQTVHSSVAWDGDISAAPGSRYKREFIEIDQDFFDHEYAEIKELVPDYAGMRIDAGRGLNATVICILAVLVVVSVGTFFILRRKNSDKRI